VADIGVAISLEKDTKDFVTQSIWMLGGMLVVVIAIYFVFKKA